MLVRIADTLIDLRSEDCPASLRPFALEGPRPDAPADLTVDIRRLAAPPDLPEPEYEISLTCVAHDDSTLLGWNRYEGFEGSTALLRLDGMRATILMGPATWECSVLNMLMLALLPEASRSGTLLLHASLVEVDGRAVAFTASSGTGKSTQADLWAAHLGATIMNGDRAFLRRCGDGWVAYGSPWAGSSPYVRNLSAPLAAVVALEQAPENAIRRIRGPELVGRLYNNLRYPLWDEGATACSLASFDALAREVPVYLLSCRPDVEAALLTREAVLGGGR